MDRTSFPLAEASKTCALRTRARGELERFCIQMATAARASRILQKIRNTTDQVIQTSNLFSF